jgi:hypothetical protein
MTGLNDNNPTTYKENANKKVRLANFYVECGEERNFAKRATSFKSFVNRSTDG